MDPTEASTTVDPTTASESKTSSTYSFLFLVVNLTGYDLDKVKITHNCGGAEEVFGGDDFQMDTNQSFPFEITTAGYNFDIWGVWLKVPTGDGWNIWHRYNKTCNVTRDDALSGRPGYIILHGRNDGWSIQLPQSSSCMNNGYS